MNRVRFAIAALAALTFAALSAGPAVAQNGADEAFDPLNTNIPSLAWRGEELRLVKCVQLEGNDEIVEVLQNGDADGDPFVDADWIVEDWSGYPFQPPALEHSTVKFFEGTGERAGWACIKANFVSLKAGLAIIKLVVSDQETGNPVLKHQFLAGWLGIDSVTLEELSETSQPGGGGELGDPLGDGNLIAGGDPGRIQVEVTGDLPLGNNFVELGLPPSIKLPTEANGSTYWDELAVALATTADTRPLYRDEPWRMWDIHDDRTTAEGHVDIVECAPGPLAAVDAVDDCDGDAFVFGGTFSRVFGDQSHWPTIGPFDPLRANETLLSDGKLDDGDVPMPAARVDVGIEPNTGGPTDISGVGFLSGVLKCEPYTRDHTCLSDPASRNHNFYAPYYARYQPATGALHFPDGEATPVGGQVEVAEASGNDGPPLGNNFPGYGVFSTFDGFYPYWLIDQSLRDALGGDTQCLRRDPPIGADSIWRQLPAGIQEAVIFTDEHGEAQIKFFPGLGFFFDNLGIVVNANGGCDLQGIDVLGTADITAVARYPYQKTTDPDKVSNTLPKIIHSLFDKDIDCVPKGPVPPIENSLAFICTATAIDIDGTPFVGEPVCFVTNGEGLREFPLGAPSFEDGLHRLCVITNDEGEASVEVFGKCLQGNVIAEFVEEGLIRFETFTFGCPPGAGGGTQVGGGAAANGVDPGSLTPGMTTAQVKSIIQKAKKPQAKPKKASLAFARIQKKPFAKKGDRYLVVRVNSAAKTARVRVTLVGPNGRVIGKVVRKVQTNRVVRVPKLKLPAAVKTARVKVLA